MSPHCETSLELACSVQFEGQGERHSPKPFVYKAFEKYLECGFFAHGFGSDKRGDKSDELHLTPLELIERIAALGPAPRAHRHCGVLAPNSPHRAAVTEMAQSIAVPSAVTAAGAGRTSQHGCRRGAQCAGLGCQNLTPYLCSYGWISCPFGCFHLIFSRYWNSG